MAPAFLLTRNVDVNQFPVLSWCCFEDDPLQLSNTNLDGEFGVLASQLSLEPLYSVSLSVLVKSGEVDYLRQEIRKGR